LNGTLRSITNGDGDRGDQLLDLGGEPAVLGGQRIELVEQHPGWLSVPPS
jgi:hypothetical protein